MTHAEGEQLRRGLAALGIPSGSWTIAKLLEFGYLLLEANRITNLTGAKTIEAVIGEHILDSLAPLQHISMKDPVVDVGSGGGFPGIPAAVVYPNKRFILIEPRAKRAAFLEHTIKRLDLPNVTVLKSSAQGSGVRLLAGASGTVLMRAVAAPQKSLQIGLPLLASNGTLLLFEGRAAAPTAQDRMTARKHGATIKVHAIRVPGLDATRHAWVVKRDR
ncbi:MAG: 16S rRNA (guanine(527)-N(7))-methyltransferase RsmG [Candidatus Eremiobacteraeota bacterium]|nr:16S rRNA (guanine(527)-N(7))-methyltransferase RsmG [Candidatus Eremiobacteraeota bacterium]